MSYEPNIAAEEMLEMLPLHEEAKGCKPQCPPEEKKCCCCECKPPEFVPPKVEYECKTICVCRRKVFEPPMKRCKCSPCREPEKCHCCCSCKPCTCCA